MSSVSEPPGDIVRAFTPDLADLIDDPLFARVWTDPRLSPRDRSIATLAALVALRPEAVGLHLRRALDNGVTREEISALITHVAFYAGFPAAVVASQLARSTLD